MTRHRPLKVLDPHTTGMLGRGGCSRALKIERIWGACCARCLVEGLRFGCGEHANIAQGKSASATHRRGMNQTHRSEGFAFGPATVRIGDFEVQRIGYGSMRLPGPDALGEPADPERARKVLRRAVELGVNFIDTAWFYGPLVANRLITEALHPYPRDLVIATKLGTKRTPDKKWALALRPEELRKGAEDDLRSLRRERLDAPRAERTPRNNRFAQLCATRGQRRSGHRLK
jgi:hypothetical protein